MVTGLAEAAERIGQVVSLINDIAAQTNLLALNATIEAARAGEAGKGFVVVAQEVKNLANQTAKATDEIAQQIGSIQSETHNTVDAIEKVTRTISGINEITAAIAAAVEQQGAATAEISGNVQQAAAGTNEVSSSIGIVRNTAQQTGEAASNVQSDATELAVQARKLDTEVKNFLNQLRTI
jgi:methyl-accepting chemotaxis protein